MTLLSDLSTLVSLSCDDVFKKTRIKRHILHHFAIWFWSLNGLSLFDVIPKNDDQHSTKKNWIIRWLHLIYFSKHQHDGIFFCSKFWNPTDLRPEKKRKHCERLATSGRLGSTGPFTRPLHAIEDLDRTTPWFGSRLKVLRRLIVWGYWKWEMDSNGIHHEDHQCERHNQKRTANQSDDSFQSNRHLPKEFRNLNSDYTESCRRRSVNQEMWSRRCDTAEMCEMRRFWRYRNCAECFFIVWWLRRLGKSAPENGRERRIGCPGCSQNLHHAVARERFGSRNRQKLRGWGTFGSWGPQNR